MKYILLLILFFSFTCKSFSTDTTKVRIHDHTDMTWNGNYDEWGLLPDETTEYRKILMHYTMGCATGGCSEWDYTTKVLVRHRTGERDSTLQEAPSFTVNGSNLDTLLFSDVSYIHYWDTLNNSLDSLLSDSLEIILFNDSLNPTTPSDTLYKHQTEFYNMVFDTAGHVIDSIYVAATDTFTTNYYNWYQVFDVIEDFELARVITPYGGYLDDDWEFTTTFDVTDFVQVLRDSVEIRCRYSGWSSGFSATLDFEFIEGKPAQDVLKIDPIYSGSYNYINGSDFEANKLVPKRFLIDENTTAAKVKMCATGHGFDNSQYAAEFKPINYYLKIDGLQTHTQLNWDADCGENPIYPQAGTWLYDRANWCPGKRAQVFEHEISPYITPGDSLEVNIDFQSYSWSGTQTPSYSIETQLVQYKEVNFSNSAEIVDIIKPSLKDEYSRKNPVCGKPLIVIRNYGSTPLTSLEIEYKVVGGSSHTYQWSGNLAFTETEEVELPNVVNWKEAENTFEVTLKQPNGVTDEYPKNNHMQSQYEPVPNYPETFSIWLATNSGVLNTNTQESETSWNIYDTDGTVVFSSGSLLANTTYKDTLTFNPGCYTFVLEDADEDGLNYFANDDGNGSIRFKRVPGSWLNNFNSNFGTNIVHQFTVDYQTNLSEVKGNSFELFPNPASNQVSISVTLNKPEKIDILIFNSLGQEMERITKENFTNGEVTFNTSSYTPGIYFCKIKHESDDQVRKFVILD